MFLRNLPVGTKVREKKSGVTFIVAEHNHAGYSETTLITDEIIEYAAFDGAEKNNPNEEISKYGNNDYELSNIHRWLNSDKEDWFVKSHESDESPSKENVVDGDPYFYNVPFYAEDGKYCLEDRSYNNKPGFLSVFEKSFVKMIFPTELEYNTLIEKGNNTSKKVYTKVFLPSMTELGVEKNEGEGTKIKLFEDPRFIFCGPKPSVIGKENDYNYFGASWWYWTRSSFEKEFGYGRRMCPGHRGGDENDATRDITSCKNASGIRPLINLFSGAPVSDEPDENGIYVFRKSDYWAPVVDRPLKRWEWTHEIEYELPDSMKYNPKCPCHNTSCARNGFCKACVEFHKGMDHLQFCRHGETD